MFGLNPERAKYLTEEKTNSNKRPVPNYFCLFYLFLFHNAGLTYIQVRKKLVDHPLPYMVHQNDLPPLSGAFM